jgi:exodeoxyribonuclease VII large subunit
MSSKSPSLFDQKREILTVTHITRQIRDLLRETFQNLWVTGEVSNLTYHRSGHVYFTLKDEGAALSCVMWRSAASKLRFRLEEGSEVVALGSISVYEPRGNYQLIVTHVEPKGIGALALAFEQLKKKLAEEGLFDEHHKKPLPFLPRRIAVITSPTGAAVRDITRTILGRFPAAHIIVHPSRVQGEGAAEEIARAIANVNEMKEADVMIVGRGGGSLEDLWPFNEEVTARAIFASTIPVISAVGHEVDITISDFVADARAATPTAAGEMVVPAEEELRLALMQVRQRLALALRNVLQRLRTVLDSLSASYALRKPAELLAQRAQHLDELWRRLNREVKVLLDTSGKALEASKSHLESLNPLNVLARGYSITTLKDSGTPLKDTSGLSPGQAIETVLSSGRIVSEVRDTKKK